MRACAQTWHQIGKDWGTNLPLVNGGGAHRWHTTLSSAHLRVYTMSGSTLPSLNSTLEAEPACQLMWAAEFRVKRRLSQHLQRLTAFQWRQCYPGTPETCCFTRRPRGLARRTVTKGGTRCYHSSADLQSAPVEAALILGKPHQSNVLTFGHMIRYLRIRGPSPTCTACQT